MPSGTIPIVSYTVRVARNTSTQFARITILGPVLSHGIQNRATLYFFPSYGQLNGWALNVGGLNFDGIHVLGQVPFADFDRMYDLLRNEAPVQLYYTYGTSSSTTKPLNLVAVETGNEPPGEGPADEDSVEQAFALVRKMTTLETAG
ncbi:hypothetical protein [Actinotalea sp. K2]|uniref:hypothetical protein n=1 Tax=Actinotalea sp. K2 TaxID=2939438 RepID=UPI002017A4E7|nr:hypothetical protein [Actinotalea sp. K2]MCL3862350.1 hypothetical protein [Actinotalea sp. K2]